MQRQHPHSYEEALIKDGQLSFYSSFLRSSNPRPDNLTAIIMHGAGESNSLRHAGLAAIFADNGISVISLDFVGHGKTGGKIADNSLELRTKHACMAIDHWTDDSAPLILCGFSMSGHTVLQLLPQLAPRVKGIGLFCPATYAAEAETVPFGPEFTAVIRKSEGWRSSLGLQAATQFTGRAAIVIGSRDQVIPWEVVAEMTCCLTQHTTQLRLEVVGGVEHQLAGWLSEHVDFSERIVRYLADG